MDPRHGVCSACGAQFKIPAAFAHDQARCSSCGGTVRITPPRAGAAPAAPSRPAAERAPAAPPVPARKPTPTPPAKPASATPPAKPAAATPPAKSTPASQPKPAAAAQRPPASRPAPEPAAKKGPSMKEQILARRAGDAGEAPPTRAAKPSSQPAPKAGARKALPRSSAAAAAAQPTHAASAPRRSSPASAATPSGRSRAGAPAGGKHPARATAAAGSRPGRSRRRGGKDEDGDGPRHGRHAKSKPALVPMLVATVLIVAAGAGTWWYLQPEPSVNAGGTDAVAQGGATAQTPAEGASAAGAEATPSEEPAVADAGSEDAESAAEADAPADADPTPAAAAAGPDPDSVDLSAQPTFGPADGSSPEEHDSLSADVAEVIDPNAGAAGTRARTRLEEAGKAAFPAILNAMKEIDYSTEQGYRDGDLLQRTLMKIVGGRNFGWRYTTEPKDVYFNKKVVQAWAGQWQKVVDNPEYWEAFAKKGGEEPGEGTPGDEDGGLDLGDLDDLGG